MNIRSEGTFLKDANELSKRYNSLFSLPSKKTLIISTYIFSLIRGLLDSALITTNLLSYALFTITLSVTYFFTLISLSLFTVAIIGKERRILDFRRTIGLFLLSSVIGLIFHIPFLILLRAYHNVALGLETISIGITMAYISLSLPAIIKTSYLKSAFVSYLYASFFIYIESHILNLLPNSTNFYMAFTALTSLFIFSSLITLKAINRLGEEKNVGALDAFRGFMALWLNRDKESIEDFFDKIGQERDITLGVVGFKDQKTKEFKALWVLSNIHPGPFLNAGSAMMTYELSKALEEQYSLQCVSVLHGTCSHYHNLTKSEYIAEVASWVKKSLENSKVQSVFNYYRINKEPLTFSIFQFDDMVLPIITCETCSMDDISYTLGLLAINKEKPTFIIDAHNSLDKRNNQTPADLKPWHPYGKMILEWTRKAEPNKNNWGPRVLLGVAKNRQCKEKFKGSVGSDGIAAYVFNNGEDRRIALIVIDSNNLEIGVRNRLRNRIILDTNLGIEDAEIVTTDTHEVNAASPKEGSYPMLSREQEEELFDCLKTLIEMAKENETNVEITSHIGEIKNIRVWGEENYNFLKSLVYHGLTVFKYIFNTALLLDSITTVLFFALTNLL